MRAIWVAGVGGLLIGHMLWLVGISLAIASTRIPTWVLVVAAASFVVAAVSVVVGRHRWKQKTRSAEIWAAFLWGLPISPVLLSLAVLGVTYL